MTALDVTCPTCHAGAWQPCHARLTPHIERHVAAALGGRKEQKR